MKEHRQSGHISDEGLVLLSNGELTPERSDEVRAHVDACGRCRDRLAELQRAFDAFVQMRSSSIPQIPPGDVSRAELQRRLEAARAAPRSWLDRLAAQPAGFHLALGLATLCIVAAGTLLTSQHQPPPRGSTADGRSAPDPRLTPGLTVALSRAELCAAEEEQPAPPVDKRLALEVFRLYRITDPQPRAYEVDFLIPPELGGASDIRNLWPQPYDLYPWNAHAKDALEDFLVRSVCSGQLDLQTAQRDLSEGWIAAYQKHFRTAQPLVEHASFLKDEPWQ